MHKGKIEVNCVGGPYAGRKLLVGPGGTLTFTVTDYVRTARDGCQELSQSTGHYDCTGQWHGDKPRSNIILHGGNS